MIRLKVTVFIGALFLAGVVKAEESVMSLLTPTSSFHVLDNLTPATFYDVNSGQWLIGGVTSLYQVKHVSFDTGLVQPLSGGSAIPLVGLNGHFGSFLNSFPVIKSFTSVLFKDKTVLTNFACGAWMGPDLSQGFLMYGLYTGLQFKY